MARTDNDTWDVASSVGARGTTVAAALVRAVGIDFFTNLVDGEIPTDDGDDGTTTRLMTGVRQASMRHSPSVMATKKHNH